MNIVRSAWSIYLTSTQMSVPCSNILPVNYLNWYRIPIPINYCLNQLLPPSRLSAYDSRSRKHNYLLLQCGYTVYLSFINCIGCRTASVENRHHNADTEERHAGVPERLPANIDHRGPVAVVGAVCRPEVYPFSSVSTVPVAGLQRSVRVQADRLDDGCDRSDVIHTVRSMHSDYDYVQVSK